MHLVRSEPRQAVLPPPFSLVVSTAGETAVISLHGVLDHAGLAHLREVLGDLDRQETLVSIVVDARHALGVHPSVLAVFSEAAASATRKGATFELLRSSPSALRVC